MANYHSTTIVGHLGGDPDVRYMPSGDAVCNFTVAVKDSWKATDGAKKEQTTWYRVNAFKKLAEICGEYLKKGAQVMIVGKMGSRKWTDKDGVEQTSWELRADTMQMFGKAESQPRQDAKPAAKDSGGGFSDMESDIPFLNIGRGIAGHCYWG